MKTIFKHLTIAKIGNIMLHAWVISLIGLSITGILYMFYGLVFLDFAEQANFGIYR
tara:strand:+ start:588 stop:755 length:168 start_codon:yes stop_codon:yes gene_type:complete